MCRFTCYYPYTHAITHGDMEGTLTKCTEAGVTVEGTMFVGGQEHFYLEPHCLQLVPGTKGLGWLRWS